MPWPYTFAARHQTVQETTTTHARPDVVTHYPGSHVAVMPTPTVATAFYATPVTHVTPIVSHDYFTRAHTPILRPHVACAFSAMRTCDSVYHSNTAAQQACRQGARDAHLLDRLDHARVQDPAYAVGQTMTLTQCPVTWHSRPSTVVQYDPRRFFY